MDTPDYSIAKHVGAVLALLVVACLAAAVFVAVVS